MPLDPQAFRQAMGSLAAGVAVITARTAEGVTLGMTATSVTSLSLDPPLLLVCVDHDAELHEPIRHAEWFGVQFLAAGQHDLAVRFSTRGRHALADLEALTPAGFPRLPGVLAVVDCRQVGLTPGGDHSIVVGRLEWAETRPGEPLLYFDGRYGRFAS